VHKYGQIIGYATSDIRPGDRVHTHNLGFGKGEGEGEGALHLEVEFSTAVPNVDYVSPAEQRSFPGFARPMGVSVHQLYWCSLHRQLFRSTVNAIADHFAIRTRCAIFRRGCVFAVTHKSGCGQHLGGADHQVLQRTVAGMADIQCRRLPDRRPRAVRSIRRRRWRRARD
jgi:altronate hydrolase